MYLIFVSSLNKNMELAKVLQEQLSQNGKDSKIINLVDLNLPLYDSVKEEKDGIPKVLEGIISQMETASGYVFISPEYNYSTTPVLLNFIAWVSRIGDDFRKLFTLKVVQLATHAGGGGQDGVNAMRVQLVRLGSIVMPREIITSYTNPLREDSSKRILEQFIKVAK